MSIFPWEATGRELFAPTGTCFLTFLASGLWHGASWTYVIWGGIHGLGQILERMVKKCVPAREERKGFFWVRVLGTFAFVCFAWIFFRANTLKDAGYVVTHLFTGLSHPRTYLLAGYEAFKSAGLITSSGIGTLVLCCIFILVLLVHDYMELRTSIWERLGRFRKPVRYAFYFLLLFAVLYSRQLGEYEFVYFQF